MLLSGALFMAVQTRRRAQFRNRRPGRAVAAPAPELAPVEMTMTATGAAAAATVEFTHEALRRLADTVGTSGGTMPPLAAVELGHGKLTLHLSAPTPLPAPWIGSPDQTHWHVSTDVDVDDLGPNTGYVEAPYPLLVTIGTSDTGETWLLNCEELSTLTISGDPTYGRDFARHLAAQLAVNPWSRQVQLDCIGVAEETVAMDERITYHPTGAAGTPATAEILAAAVTTVDRATRHDTDVSTARTGRVDDDVWPARMLLLDAAAGDPDDLDQLLQLVNDHVGQAATSIVVAGERPNTPGAVLHMTNTGRVILEHAGLNLIAVGLTSDEARGCALVYAQSDNVEDVPVPVDETATDGWESYTDQSGALRREHTLPRNTPEDAVDEPLSSLLEGDDEDYIRESAIVHEDLETLAPKVPAHVRAEVEEKDPTLDQDIADWFSPTCDRPRLSLLGPVTARTHGKALAKRKPYFTELLAFLALHRKNGATREEICEAFGIEAGKARDYTKIVRDWLGTNPTHRRAPPAPRRPGTGHQGQRRSTSTRSTTASWSTCTCSPDSGPAARPAEEPKGSRTCARPSSWSAPTARSASCGRTGGPGSPTNATGSTSWPPAGSPTSLSSSSPRPSPPETWSRPAPPPTWHTWPTRTARAPGCAWHTSPRPKGTSSRPSGSCAKRSATAPTTATRPWNCRSARGPSSVRTVGWPADLGKEHQTMTTFDQELTGRYVSAGGHRPSIDAAEEHLALISHDVGQRSVAAHQQRRDR